MPDVTAAEIEQALDGLRVVIRDWRPLAANPDMAIGTVANPHGLAAELKREIGSYPHPGPAVADGEVTAALAEIKARGYERDRNGAAAFRQSDSAARDVPRLLAAVDKALKLAATWEADAAGLDRDVTSSRQSPYPGDHHLADTDQALAAQYRECASDLRGELLAALKGEN